MTERPEQLSGRFTISLPERIILARLVAEDPEWLSDQGIELPLQQSRLIHTYAARSAEIVAMSPEEQHLYLHRLARKLGAAADVATYDQFKLDNPIPQFSATRQLVEALRPALISPNFLTIWQDRYVARHNLVITRKDHDSHAA